jgi:hypothetical protein
MSEILAPGTRVTISYALPYQDPQPTQGSITDQSTEDVAHVEVLGLAKRVYITLRWDEVSKNEYRCFQARELDGQVVITEQEPKNLHPMNWAGMGLNSREGAWAFARARGMETVFVGRDGARKNLGKVFDPRAFERAAYQGYVSHGLGMTDGYYAPLKFEQWVALFRRHPAEVIAHENDVAESVKAALPLYQEALAQALVSA